MARVEPNRRWFGKWDSLSSLAFWSLFPGPPKMVAPQLIFFSRQHSSHIAVGAADVPKWNEKGHERPVQGHHEANEIADLASKRKGQGSCHSFIFSLNKFENFSSYHFLNLLINFCINRQVGFTFSIRRASRLPSAQKLSGRNQRYPFPTWRSINIIFPFKTKQDKFVLLLKIEQYHLERYILQTI